MAKKAHGHLNRTKCVGILLGMSAAFALSACLVWLGGCTTYVPSELDNLNSSNVVLDIQRDKLNFSLGMEVDSTDIVVRCKCVAADGVNSVQITRADIESGRVTHTEFDTSTVGNRTVTVSIMGKDFPIEYSVDEYKINLFSDERGTVYRSLDQDDMGAYLTGDLDLICGINLSDYNYALDKSVIGSAEGLKFCGWYDADRNAYTGGCYLNAPSEGNKTALNLYAGYLSDEEFANYDLRYSNGQKEFFGYKGKNVIEGGVLEIPESVTTVNFKGVVKGEELPYSIVDFPSTASLPFPLSERVKSSSITGFRVDGGHGTYSDYDGAIYNKSGTTLYYMPSGRNEAQFSSNLTTVAPYACADSAITKVSLPGSIRVLQTYCFAYSQLQEIVGLENATTVMSTAFKMTPYESRGEWDERYKALYTKVYDEAEQFIGYNLQRVDDKSITSFTARPDTISVSGDAFINFKELITVDLGGNVKSLGSSVFSGCVKLKTVKGLENVTEAGSAVFYNCSSLESVAFPDVKFVYGTASYAHVLPNQTFYGCESLKSVTLSSDITGIGAEAFRGCESLSAFSFESLVSLSNIGSYAFYGSGVRSAVFPSSLSSIGGSAFRYSGITEADFSACGGLIEFISNLQTSTGTYIFANTGLKHIVLPENLRSIPATCFSACKSLVRVSGGEKVEWIGMQAFKDCSSLSVFDFGSMDSLRIIAGSAFRNTALTDVVLSDSVETVGAQAFGECKLLSHFHLGAGVRTFGTYKLENNDFTGRNPVFLDTVGLSSITVSENNPYYLAEDGVLYGSIPDDSDYAKGTTLVCVPARYPDETFTPRDTVKLIFPYSVINQTVVKTVVLNEGAINIGTAAFYKSQSLTSIEISSSVEHIGANILSNCPGVSEIFIAKGNRIYSSSDDGRFIYKSAIGELILAIAPQGDIVIEDNTKSIASGVFMNTDITSVVIPDSVQTIGSKAFYGCLYLTSIKIGSGLSSFDSDVFGELIELESVTLSGDNAKFKVENGCLYSKDGTILYLSPAKNGLTTLDLNGVKEVSDWAVAYHQTLENVVMPEGLQSIGNYSFYECRRIASLRFPDSLREIGKLAFSFDAAIQSDVKNELRKCDTLKYVILDCKDITIDSTAFDGQYGIERLYLTFKSGSVSDAIALMGKVGEYIANGCPRGDEPGYYNEVQRCLYAETNDSLTSYNGYVWWHYDENGDPVLWEQTEL